MIPTSVLRTWFLGILGWVVLGLGIYLIYPQRRYLATKVRSFIELLDGRWGTNPEADPFWGNDQQSVRVVTEATVIK